jgi:hypothetical protein
MELSGDTAHNTENQKRDLLKFHPKGRLEHTNTQVTIYVHIGNSQLLDEISTDVL